MTTPSPISKRIPTITVQRDRSAGTATVQGTFVKYTNPFADVKDTDYFYDPVEWAVINGITNGTSNTIFSPDMICTRAQTVTFLWRFLGK